MVAMLVVFAMIRRKRLEGWQKDSCARKDKTVLPIATEIENYTKYVQENNPLNDNDGGK